MKSLPFIKSLLFVVTLVLWCEHLPLFATEYFVSPTGSDATPRTVDKPYRTLREAMKVLRTGDVLTVEAGTYTDPIDEPVGLDNSQATDWNNTIIIRARPGATVILKPSSGERVFTFQRAKQSYVILEGFILDAQNVQRDGVKITHVDGDQCHHVWLRNCTIMNAPFQGILLTQVSAGSGGGFNRISNLDVYSNGFQCPQAFEGAHYGHCHGIYAAADENLIENSKFHDNSGWGIHVYSGSYEIKKNIVRDNWVYNNGTNAVLGDGLGHVGIGLYSGPGHEAYGNTVWGNYNGIVLRYGAENSVLHDNIIYKNKGSDGYGVPIDVAGTNTNDSNPSDSIYNNTYVNLDVPDPFPLPPVPVESPPSCGNSVVEAGEACDGGVIPGGAQCSLYPGFTGGAIRCNSTCTGFDYSSCSIGQQIRAASCEQTDVQTAINQAPAGAVVNIPEGTCTWTTPNSCAGLQACAPVKIVNKNLTLQGAGPTKTVIRSGVTGTNWDRTTLYVEPSLGKPFRISGMKFLGGEGGTGIIYISGDVNNFRIDNLIMGEFAARGVFISGASYGVVDHSTFTTQLHAQSAFVRGPKDAWKKGPRFGQYDNVIFEDCVFIHSDDANFRAGAVDGDDGARYVVRYSTAINSHIFYHGPEVSGLRGGLSLEVYKNHLMSRGTGAHTLIDLWGGTGVFFENKMSGNVLVPLLLQNRRSCDPYPVFGQCQTGNPFDGPGLNGYPCLDQIGRSTDNNSSTTQPQKYDPLYEWGNNLNGVDVDFQLNQGCAQMTEQIQSGRDYFNDTSRPGYRPYPYPHPLINGLVVSPPPNGGNEGGNDKGDESTEGGDESNGAVGFLLFKNFFNPKDEPLIILMKNVGDGESLSIYNFLGEEVRKLNCANNQAVWDGRNFEGQTATSGTYLIKLKLDDGVFTSKAVVVK